MSALDVTTHLDPPRPAGPSSGSPPLPFVPIALALIVFGFVVLASVVAYKTPAWQSSDEPEHVQNIETLVSGRWYGIDLDCKPNPLTVELNSCNGDEAQQAPLYYLLMAGWQKIAGLPPEVHPQLAQDVTFLQWLRFGNILLGVGTVLMAFLAARVVARDRWTPLIAASLVAFFPGFLFLSAFVTNDNLVNLLGAILTYCALRFCRGGTTQWMLATGGAFGLLVTTKLSVLPLAPLIPLLAFLAPTWRRRGWLLACGLLSALAVSGWYLIQNWVRYGDPLAPRLGYLPDATQRAGLGGLGLPDSLRREEPAPSRLRQCPENRRHEILVRVRLGCAPLVDDRGARPNGRRRCGAPRPSPSTAVEASTRRTRSDLGALVFLCLVRGVPDQYV